MGGTIPYIPSYTVWSRIEIERKRRSEILEWSADHDDTHTDSEWLILIGRQYGRVADEIWPDDNIEKYPVQTEREIIQLAALCHAWLEANVRKSLRRGGTIDS